MGVVRAYVSAALVVAFDTPLDTTVQAALGPDEAGAAPKGGWKLIGQRDVRLSVAAWQAVAANGGATGPEIIDGMVLAAVKIRELVGVQAGYRTRIGPGAALRAVAAEVGAIMAEAKQLAVASSTCAG